MAKNEKQVRRNLLLYIETLCVSIKKAKKQEGLILQEYQRKWFHQKEEKSLN